MSDLLVLGIETSCDETSAAVLRGAHDLRSHVILSQDMHAVYGGVVPELAARAHLQVVDDVVGRALDDAGCMLADLDGIGVTAGPGLIGALLVGVCWAKAAAYASGVPTVGVHHMEAHLFAPHIEDPAAEPPFVALLVSGGHTLLLHAAAWGEYQLLGRTRDDAAGEAFDKVARLLGLPYPGGAPLEALAKEGDPERYSFPRPLLASSGKPDRKESLDFSFSGLKTAVATQVAELEANGDLDAERANVAASFQAAVIDVLAVRTAQAVERTGTERILVAGGVSANSALRRELRRRHAPEVQLYHATPRLSVDNGAMVARAAAFHLDRGESSDLDLSADASLPFPGLRE